MATSQYYKQAIDLLTDKRRTINYEYIVIELAKRNPKLLVTIASQERNLFEVMAKEPWKSVVRTHIMAGNKIEAIKELRSAAGFGLKEAKDIAEYTADLIWPACTPTCGNHNMPQSQIDLAHEIAA